MRGDDMHDAAATCVGKLYSSTLQTGQVLVQLQHVIVPPTFQGLSAVSFDRWAS